MKLPPTLIITTNHDGSMLRHLAQKLCDDACETNRMVFSDCVAESVSCDECPLHTNNFDETDTAYAVMTILRGKAK